MARSNLILIVLTLLLAPAWPGRADDPAAEAQRQRRQRLWDQHWREFAAHYLSHGEALVCFPAWDRAHANSSGQSARDYAKQSARKFTVRDDKGRDVEKLMVKPQPEIDAATRLLPSIEPGSYGTIHSGMIASIEGPDALVLREVWLVDARQVREDKARALEELRRQSWREAEDALRDRDRRGPSIVDRHFRGRDLVDWQFEEREAAIDRQLRSVMTSWRISGFDTSSLTQAKRWPAGDKGIEIAVVAVDAGTVVAVPASRLGRGVSEAQFRAGLEQRGYTVERFVDLIVEQKRQAGLKYKQAVLAMIEGLDRPPANADVREVAEP